MMLRWHCFLRLEGPLYSINRMHEDEGVYRLSVAVYAVNLSDILFVQLFHVPSQVLSSCEHYVIVQVDEE